MATIKNLTNSPYDLDAIGGPVRLPSHGSVTSDFAATYLQSLRDCGLYEVSESAGAASDLTDSEEAELIGAMTDDELRDFIERKTGKKAHHKAGHDKLVTLATEAAEG